MTHDAGQRLNANATAATHAALERLMAREGVTFTEALRRLVSYGDLAHRSVHGGAELLTRRGDTVERLRVVE